MSASSGVAFEHQPASEPAPLVSIVMPCLNEAETLAACIGKAREALRSHGLDGEIIVADNGSSDGSQQIAEGLGARVVHVERRGYGAALMEGISAARGRYVVMGDADASYDFGDVPRFVDELRRGADLVMGNRFRGGIEPGAMPPLHRYLGNPVLSAVGRIFFRAACRDFHCGLRGFTRDAFRRMDLRTTGMEFASEMVVKSSLFGLKIAEVPTTLAPDGRNRPPHLRTWHDGWRHLRFLLLYSPRWLFLFPGLALMLLGAICGAWLLPHPRTVGSVSFDIHTLLYAAIAVLLGFQSVCFAVFTMVFAISSGLLPPDKRLNKIFRRVTLEWGLVAGAALMVVGLAGSIYAAVFWGRHSFGQLQPTHVLRIVIPSAMSLALGAQAIFASFFLSILGMSTANESPLNPQ